MEIEKEKEQNIMMKALKYMKEILKKEKKMEKENYLMKGVI